MADLTALRRVDIIGFFVEDVSSSSHISFRDKTQYTESCK